MIEMELNEIDNLSALPKMSFIKSWIFGDGDAASEKVKDIEFKELVKTPSAPVT